MNHLRHVRPIAAARVLAVLASGGLALLSPGLARAQSVEVLDETSLPRVDSAGNPVEKRRADASPESVSYADCVADQAIRFPLRLGGFTANASLEARAAYSGTDCALVENRVGTRRLCWPLALDVPLSSSTEVTVPVRAILAGARDTGTPDATAAICGAVDLTIFDVQFLYFAAESSRTPAVGKAITVEADTVGPRAPTITATFVPDAPRPLEIEWNPLERGVTRRLDFYVANEADRAACASSFGTPPVLPSSARMPFYSVEEGYGNAGSVQLGSTPEGLLRAGDTHAFAVAAVDRFENSSVLSNVACIEVATDAREPNAPADADDGTGNASGEEGGCSTSGRAGATGSLLAAALAALGLARVRRRIARAA